MAKKKNRKMGKGMIALISVAVFMLLSFTINELIASITTKTKEIGVSEYSNLMNDTNEKLVLLKSDNCTICDDMSKILENINKTDNIAVYTINVNELSMEDKNTIYNSSSLIVKDVFPSVIYISGGAVIDNYTGVIDEAKIIEMTELFTKISVEEYMIRADLAEESYIYIGRPTCSHCVASMPLLKRIIKETGKKIYYINIDEETSDSLSKLNVDTTGIYDGSTPLFMVVKNGQILRNQAGAGAYETLKSFFLGID